MTILTYTVGFLAQTLFFTRFLIQWILSEKAKKVLSPVVFWQISLIASLLLFLYGWLRDDFAILLGQLLSYYIYIWNLKIQRNWQQIPGIIRGFFFLTPIVATIWMIGNYQITAQHLFHNEEVPLKLLLWGSAGQVIFTMRFIYQWLYSRKRAESLLPSGFWIISLAGALIILSYAIYRVDPVLMIGQGTGILIYSRNLFLQKRAEIHG